MVARRRRRGGLQTHSHDGRAPEAARHEHSAGARRLGGARGGAGLREVARAGLEAVDALLDVLRVRVDGRGHDLGEVVRQEVGGVEARVAGAVAPSLPIVRTARKEAEAPGAAAPNATQGLYYEGHYLVALIEPRVVVVALEEGHVALARLVVKGAIRGAASGVPP